MKYISKKGKKCKRGKKQNDIKATACNIPETLNFYTVDNQ